MLWIARSLIRFKSAAEFLLNDMIYGSTISDSVLLKEVPSACDLSVRKYWPRTPHDPTSTCPRAPLFHLH
jgi:hypothetical protein